jgi:hypothetical protein
MRLISSGIVRSPLRRPASTWATRIPSLLATSAAAAVEFTSPYTTTQFGRSASRTGSIRSMMRAVCTACDADPTSRLTSGAGMPRSRKNEADIASS